MEISLKSNFRFKALVIALVAIVLTTACTPVFGVNLTNIKDEKEVTLNRKVYFTGNTYYRSDGKDLKVGIGRLSKNFGAEQKTGYTEANPGCGIIDGIIPGAKYPFHVAFEGWIELKQVMTEKTERFITLEVDKSEKEGIGFISTLTVNGEVLNVESKNEAVVNIDENGVISAGIDGQTTVNITTEKFGEIELAVAVVEGEIEVNIPEGKASAELTQGDLDLFDKKVQIKTTGGVDAAIEITEDGQVALTIDKKDGREDMFNAELYYKDEKIAEFSADGDITATASLEGVEVDAHAKQEVKLSILKDLSVKLEERAHAKANKELVEADAGAKLSANEQEIANVEAGIEKRAEEKDPTGRASFSIMGMDPIEKEGEIKVISGLEALISRMGK